MTDPEKLRSFERDLDEVNHEVGQFYALQVIPIRNEGLIIIQTAVDKNEHNLFKLILDILHLGCKDENQEYFNRAVVKDQMKRTQI